MSAQRQGKARQQLQTIGCVASGVLIGSLLLEALTSFQVTTIGAPAGINLLGHRLFKPRTTNLTQSVEWSKYQEWLVNDVTRFETREFTYMGYDGPWIETTFLKHWQTLHARGADMGDRLFLPIPYLSCLFHCREEEKAELAIYLLTLKPEYKYFSVYMGARGLDNGHGIMSIVIPRHLDLLLFASGSTTRGVRNVPLPHLKRVLTPSHTVAKDINVTFYGSVDGIPLRKRMLQLLEPNRYRIGTANFSETVEVIERSNFTLAPRGYGSTSFRLYEALQLLSIPIYVWDIDCFLPYQELVDWEDMAIVVHKNDVPSIPARIAAFDVPKAMAKLNASRGLWTYEYVNEYIVAFLRAEQRGRQVQKSLISDVHEVR